MRVLEILFERRRLVLAFVLVTLLVVASYLVLAEKQYEADAKLQVVPVAADDGTFAGFSLLREGIDEETPATTAAELVEASDVVDAVEERLGMSRDELRDAVSAKAEGASNVVTVSARWPDARRAAQIANAFAAEFVARRSSRFQADLTRAISRLRASLSDVPAEQRAEPPAREIASRLATLETYVGLPDPTVEVVSDAVAPASSVSPRPVVVAAAALGISLLVPLAAASALALLGARAPRTSRAEPEERDIERVELAPVPPAAASQDAARPPPEARPQGEPQPQPEPMAAALPASGVWSLPRLERLVEERAAEFPDRVEEWRTYLFFLRDHAAPDGQLPASFDVLVDEVFEDVLQTGTARADEHRERLRRGAQEECER